MNAQIIGRSAAACALACGVAMPLSMATASGAAAVGAGHNGFCTDDKGVTVVVDFQQLGGGVVVRCAPSLKSGGTGLDVLQAAGVPYSGVARWGDAFICRLFNKPSATQDIPISGNPKYHEACINTPPAKAYWSYWVAPNGGSWSYSQYGVTNRPAIAGGFEGWSFSLNASAQSNPQPRIAPVRPTTPAPPTKTQGPSKTPTIPAPKPSTRSSGPAHKPAPSSTARGGAGSSEGPSSTAAGAPPAGGKSGGADKAGKPGGADSGSQHNGGTTSGSGKPGAPAQNRGAAGKNSGSATAKGSSSKSLPSSLAASQPAGAATSSGTNVAADQAQNQANSSLIADSDKLIKRTTEEQKSSLNTPTLIGIGALTFAVVAGLGTALRRRGR